MAKRLEFLREIAPSAHLIALLMNPDNLNYDVDVKAAQEAARSLGPADDDRGCEKSRRN